jgi:CheY-like chemotaxis protein
LVDILRRGFGKMSLKIIVADSEPKSAPLLRSVAIPLGHSVLPFQDYEAAAQKGETQHFDVAFLGMRLPDLAGIGVAHRLRNSGPNRNAAIVMVTATDDTSIQRKAFGEGADFVVTEPVQGGRLHRMLSAMDAPDWKHHKPAARLPLFAEVFCSWLHRKEAVTSLNISQSGMLLRLLVDAPLGEEVTLEFKIAEVHASLNVRARIIRQDEEGQLVGVEFVDLSREVQNAIQAYVMGRAKDEAPAASLA